MNSMYIYPWDLLDEGITKTLKFIKAEIGISKIRIAVSYHAGKFLLPHNPRRKIYYHSSGNVYFSPNFSRYGKLVPKLGEAYNEYQQSFNKSDMDLLTKVINEAKKLNMTVGAWIVGFHNSYLGKRFPKLTTKNVFGDSYYHALCPSNIETKTYVLQLIKDLIGQYDIEDIALESYHYMGFYHNDHHEIIGISKDFELDRLLSICFCNGCKKRAKEYSVDIDELEDVVREQLNEYLELGYLKNKYQNWVKYTTMRIKVVEQLFSEINKMVKSTNVGIYKIVNIREGVDYKHFGVDFSVLGKYIDGWIIGYPNNVDDVHKIIKKVNNYIPTRNKLIGGIRILQPQITNPSVVSNILNAYRKQRVDSVSIYNYGFSTKYMLDNIYINDKLH